jgi:hypothetical protein
MYEEKADSETGKDDCGDHGQNLESRSRTHWIHT